MAMTLLAVGALVAGAMAVAAVLGAAVLAWCPPDAHPRDERSGHASPASVAPTLGVSIGVLWLSTTGLIVPPGSWTGVGSLGLAAVILVAATRWRRSEQLRKALRGQVDSFAAALVGFVCTTPFLWIMAGARSTALVHLSGNHDGFFFTAVPEWLRTHTLVGAPGMTPRGTPQGVSLIGSTWDIVQNGSWRVGSDALFSAVSRITSTDPVLLWLPLTLGYVVCFATAVHALCVRSGMRRWPALIVVGISTASTGVLQAVVDQHTPTLLALAVALVLVTEASRGPARSPSGAAPVVVAITVGTIAAVYTELLALVLLPVVALWLGSWWRQRSVDWRWLRSVAVWSVLLATAPWLRALRGLNGGNSPEGFSSAFDTGSGAFTMLHAFVDGTTSPRTWSGTAWSGRVIVLGFVVLLIAGLVAACRSGPIRAFVTVLLANLVVGWWVLGMATYSGYPQQRFVEWSVPLLLVGSLIGWVTVIGPVICPAIGRRLGLAGANRALRAAVPVALAVVLLAVPGVHFASTIRDVPSRRVDADVTMPATWVAAHDPSGTATLVYAADYFTNLWSPYVLRHQSGVAYLTLYRDYYDLDHFGSPAGRRWLLLDREALDHAQVPEGAVVASNPRFALVDLATGPVTLHVLPRFRGRWPAGDAPVTVHLDHGDVTFGTAAHRAR